MPQSLIIKNNQCDQHTVKKRYSQQVPVEQRKTIKKSKLYPF